MNLDMFYEPVLSTDDAQAMPEPMLKQRPETKTFDDVVQVIAHNPENETAINLFLEMYELGQQWDWFAAWQKWQYDRDMFNAALADNPQTLPDKPESDLLPPPVFSEPEPIRPPLLSVDDLRDTVRIDGKTINTLLYEIARAKAVDAIKVEVDGLTFDGNEISQSRMLNCIVSSEQLGLTNAVWILADNTTQMVTIKQLREAHAKAVNLMGALWIKPNYLNNSNVTKAKS